jgi:hypothetical protein
LWSRQREVDAAQETLRRAEIETDDESAAETSAIDVAAESVAR